jgi:MFS family permease
LEFTLAASLTAPRDTHISSFRSLAPWYVAEFLASYSVTLFITGCYDWADDRLGATPSQRLGISALWGFEYIFISLLAGKISEKWGPRKTAIVMTACCVIAACVALLAVAYPYLWMVPLVMAPFNFTCSTIWPSIESGVTRSPGKWPLSSRIAMFNLAWGSAGFAAIFTHGLLAKLSPTAIFIAPAIACSLACMILAIYAVPASMIGAHNVPDSSKGEHELDDPAVRRRAQMLLKMAWIGNALAYTAIYVLLPVMTQLMREAGVSDLGLAGILGAVWPAVRFITFAFAGKWTGWHYKIAWQVGPLIGLAVSLAGMLLVPVFGSSLPIPGLAVLLILQVLFGFCAAMLYSASLYYAMHVSSGHGGHAAFHEAVIGAGTMAGPLIGAVASAGKLDHTAFARIAIAVAVLLSVGIATILLMPLFKPRAERVK